MKPLVAQPAHVRSLQDYQDRYGASVQNNEQFWRQAAQRISWFAPFAEVGRQSMTTADFEWFAGGKLNASYNCVDRHAEKMPNKTALTWVRDEPGVYEHISYAELLKRVGRMANVLLHHGVKQGERVCIYMPMMPETVVAMLACARIGAVHSVVFAGFSAEALRDRIVDANCRVVLTANQGVRGGKTIPLKATVDQALEHAPMVQTVIVAQRTDAQVNMQSGRDVWLHDELQKQRAACAAVWLDAESPLYILYTSGSTGKPKGVLHTTGGYMVQTSLTHELVFDLQPNDIYMCAADVGWVTGHSYIVYGPLANGATTVLFESTPTYPDAGRYWQVVDDLGVNIFYTAPTALRAIARAGNTFVTQHKRDSLRVLGSVGEPINPEVWTWYHDVVGSKRCAVVDTWWQTETGAILIAPMPFATPTKPGSATLPLLGIEPVLVDDQGKELVGNDVQGNLCMRNSWPAQARSLYGDHERFVNTYFKTFPGLYFTGDGCRRDADGYYWITGRVDDVLNVSGHRLGTAEVESALVAHADVAEAAVVGYPHDIKGTGIFAFVQATPAAKDRSAAQMEQTLRDQVRSVIGALAVPEKILVVAGLPKTRSGKIMRRILRKIACGEYEQLGDLSTLAEPDVVARIVEQHKSC